MYESAPLPSSGAFSTSANDSTATHHPSETTHSYRDVDFSWIPTITLQKTAKFVYPVCNRTMQVMENIGGVIVHTFGLNQSRFQYAVDEYHRRERARVEKEQMAYKQERQRVLERARQGLDDDDEEDDAEDSGGSGRYCPPMPPLVSERVPLQARIASSE